MENSGRRDRWVQRGALLEWELRSRLQPNAQPARTPRCAPQAPYPAPRARPLDRASRPNRRSAAFPNCLELREAASRLGLPIDFANARHRSHEVPEESVCVSLGFSGCSGHIERAVNYFQEGALFAQDDAFGYRCLDVFARLRIDLQFLSVRFVRCKAIETNQAPRHIVCALVRQEVAHEMPATPGDDGPPVFCVLFESFPLVRIDFVSDKAGNFYCSFHRYRFRPYNVTAHRQCRCESCSKAHEFAAIYLQR